MQYEVKVVDNVISKELQDEVWNYIINQKYHASRKEDFIYPDPAETIYYIPSENKKEYLKEGPGKSSQFMHRTVFGNYEEDLEKHPPIQKLWNCINEVLDNNFIIAGDKEGLSLRIPGLPRPRARVYVNCQGDENIKRSHGIHRDTDDIRETQNYTLLYYANPEWYPTWMGENIFYEDDDTTGDKQQFQKGHGQSKNFNVGWPFKVVSPVPGRFVLYDGRTLHTTKPVAPWSPEFRYAVVFRIKKLGKKWKL
jgi:hypothetical protein